MDNRWQKLFAGVAGIWVALVLVKFGNPIILENLIEPPQDTVELLVGAWPIRWGYILLGLTFFAGLFAWRWIVPAPKWLLILPLLWFGWQLISSTQTVRADLTTASLLHFGACLSCFYLGLFVLSQVHDLRLFWLGLLAGLLVVCWVGFNQHFGGLEQTRQAFEEMKKNWDQYPPELRQRLDTPEFQKKIASNRIFATFVYPNALAGAIILLLPVSLIALWEMCRPSSSLLRKLLVGLCAYAGLACLYWSQSKAGWLIWLGVGFTAFLHLPIVKKVKWLVAGLVLVAGLAGFYIKYKDYFSHGATSAVARLDYWGAAWQLAEEKPFFGSGPGTFMVGYKRLKKPDSEMTRLAHNDYLQQAADSGWPGFLLYSTFVWGLVGLLYRRALTSLPSTQVPPCPLKAHRGGERGRRSSLSPPQGDGRNPERSTPRRGMQTGSGTSENQAGRDGIAFGVWLGLAGLAVQSLLEFGLYIPALAWPFFLLLGWLWGRVQTHKSNRQSTLPLVTSA